MIIKDCNFCNSKYPCKFIENPQTKIETMMCYECSTRSITAFKRLIMAKIDLDHWSGEVSKIKEFLGVDENGAASL